MCFIKVRFPGEKKFWFVQPNGRVGNRRIHASLFEDVIVSEVARDLREKNPALEVRVVDWKGRPVREA